MAKKKTGEPTPRFSEWVRAYGISKLTRDLGKNRDNRSVVQAWLARKQRPNSRAAIQLISLSTQHPLGGKPLTFEDIYGYFSTGEPAQVQAVAQEPIAPKIPDHSGPRRTITGRSRGLIRNAHVRRGLLGNVPTYSVPSAVAIKDEPHSQIQGAPFVRLPGEKQRKYNRMAEAGA